MQYSPESLLLQDETNSAETRRLTLQRSQIPQTVSQMLFTTPGRKSLLGHRRRFSTLAERTTSARQAGNTTTTILHFYILFSLFYLLSIYSIPYGLELSTLMIIFGLLSTVTGNITTNNILNILYERLAVPILGRYGNKFGIFFQYLLQYTINFTSPILRSIYVYIIYLSLPYTSVKQIMYLEQQIQQSRGDISYEKRQRRMSEIRGDSNTD